MRSVKQRATLMLWSAVATLAWAGCGPQPVRILLTDAPLDGASEVNVTLTGLTVVEAGPGSAPEEPGAVNGIPGTTVFDEPRSFNLLTLRNGATALLGEVDVAGRIAHLQLQLGGDAEVVYEDGSRRAAAVPSGAQTGIKLAGAFQPGVAELLLDFDAAQSVIEAEDGSLSLVPAIRIYADGREIGGADAE